MFVEEAGKLCGDFGLWVELTHEPCVHGHGAHTCDLGDLLYGDTFFDTGSPNPDSDLFAIGSLVLFNKGNGVSDHSVLSLGGGTRCTAL